jgi:hypothetical protein
MHRIDQRERLTDGAVDQQLLGPEAPRRVAQPLDDRMDESAGPRPFQQGLSLGERSRERLFAQHMLARLERRGSDGSVLVGPEEKVCLTAVSVPVQYSD